ncbi:hypothetical protein FDUTEX481_04089 [Tolypothrix sp. PCC 7601]|nr:hypothetical protein FDUTEX481_04089 [Tolypothrix sp. PCC 7601]
MLLQHEIIFKVLLLLSGKSILASVSTESKHRQTAITAENFNNESTCNWN